LDSEGKKEIMVFSQLSRGQQIRVSSAIGMALNPTLKVMFVRDGSLLDSEGKKEIAELAKSGDYQLWMELCDESGQVGFFLEDGEIKKVNDN
jgi:ABC-type polar amino acid transport system ATPase subunit